ncbi:hypothetical protein FRC07_013649 [Ceratobasidium sp. 392]|nr:hypothetical protein FRC07_013649 [Ceratobasidium sp. 392]
MASNPYSEPQSSWGIPMDTYLKKQPAHSVRKYPADQVTTSIQKFIVGEAKSFEDATLESILSVVYYPERLVLLNAKTMSNWFRMMEPYLKCHSLFDRSFGLLMIQVYGLAATVGFLYHSQTLPGVIKRLSTVDVNNNKSGVLSLLNLWTSVVADPDAEISGRSFADYVRNFTSIPDTSDPNSGSHDVVLLPNIGGFYLKDALFFLKNLFDSRDRLLEILDHVPAFGWFLLLCMMRLQIWFLLKSGDDKSNALSMLTDLQDINYRYYLASGPKEHRLVSSLMAAVLGDMSDIDPFFDDNDFIDPTGSADLAMLSLTLIRHISPPLLETDLTKLSSLWEMFEWVDKLVWETGELHCSADVHLYRVIDSISPLRILSLPLK